MQKKDYSNPFISFGKLNKYANDHYENDDDIAFAAI
jgi:hypothetical protein